MKRRGFALLLALAMVLTGIPNTGYLVAEAKEVNYNSLTLSQAKEIYKNPKEDVEKRVSALLGQMTLEEKAAQLLQPEQNGDCTPEVVKELGIGSVLNGGGSAPKSGNTAKDWQARVNEFKKAALESRLGIPLIYGVDAVHGHNNVADTVIFPHNISLGAANDEKLTEKVGLAAAEEIRATGIQWTFAPTLGVVYSERWGRFYESFGENSDLVTKHGVAYTKGFQGVGKELFGNNRVAATAKHYIGEGQTKDGVNQGDIELTEEEFDKMLVTDGLLKPYEEAIKAGARTVMVSYNSVNGVKCHGNAHLVRDILKGEKSAKNPLGLGFTGFVVSDYNGIDQLPGSYKEKVAASINAGVDMFMEPYDWKNCYDALLANVKDGSVSLATLDDAVTRVLRVKFEMGLFEEVVESDTEKQLLAKIGSKEHRAVAREAVSKSLVLLKNDIVGSENKRAMEILSEAKNILVAGYKGNDIGAQCGGWTISWQGGMDSNNGSGGKKVTTGTTIYEAIKEAAGSEKEVSYNARGKIGSGYDAAVVVVGEEPYAESNGDRTEAGLVLPNEDKNVLKTAIASAKAANTPIILVLTTGRPVAIAEYVDDVDAIIEAWLPGTEGAGVADVLLGKQDFQGTLPITWMWTPQYINDKFTDAQKVLFPYGTGLKKDGSSIVQGGQTAIPDNKPAPEEPDPTDKIVKRAGGVDIDFYNGKLEGEYANPTTGSFNSWNVSAGSENADGEKVDYLEWKAQSWGNGKWVAYFRQAGTYDVTFRMKVTQVPGKEFKFGIGRDVTGDVSTANFIETHLTNGKYEDFTIQNIEVKEPGLYGIKVMDGEDPPSGKLMMDYMKFTCTKAVGDKDVSIDVPAGDPADETTLPSQGAVISSDAVEVTMTSTEKSGNMSWYKYPTEMTNQMKKKDNADITAVDEQDLTTITVNPEKTYQELLGIGTSLEESTVNNLLQLKESVRQEFIEDLVNPEKGGMTLFRVTIGTSDFTAKKFYSYYDTRELNETNAIYNEQTKKYEPDWNNTTGNGFSIQKDRDFKLLEIIKMVQKAAVKFGVEDEVKFFASSWTPPGFMKRETANSKSYKNNELLLKGGALKDDSIEDLAMYYTRFAEEYAKEGITLCAMTLQNEPMLEIDYPSCAMTGEQEGKLAVAIKKAMNGSSVLNEEQKNARLWAFDHNPGDAYSYVEKILSVKGANEALGGIAFHDYGGSLSIMQKVLDELLNKNGVTGQTVNLTERSVWGTTGANSIITYLRNSAVSYNSWVTMLDSNVGVHQWVGTPDPTMFARAAGSDNDYWAMPEFFITGQFSKFIRPGDVRVDSTLGSTKTVTNVVFKNPETGELKAVVVNATDQKQNFKIVCEGTQIIGALPAGNVATYVWKMPENIHSNLEDGFPATQFSKATEGVKCEDTTTDNPYITMETSDDYAEFIADVTESGAYNIVLEQQPSADNQKIEVYQGETLLTSINAAKTWNSAKVLVQGQIRFEKAGIQSIRIKMAPGVKLYTIALKKTKDIHSIPARIEASDFIRMDGSSTIDNNTVLGNMSAYNNVYYKIHVPADDTYRFTMSAATENTSDVGFWLKLYDTNFQQIGGDVLAKGTGGAFGYLPPADAFNVSGSWDKFVTTGGDITLTEGDYILGFTTGGAPVNIEYISLGAYAQINVPQITEGAENGNQIMLSVEGGSIADESVASGSAICIVNGLPEGVAYEAVRTDATHYTITLVGNRTRDYDYNQLVEVKLLITQPSGQTAYSSNDFVLHAINDEEVLQVPEQNLKVPAIGEEKSFLIEIAGGTFERNKENLITLSGDCTQYYDLKEVQYVDAAHIRIVCTYVKKFYKTTDLMVQVPKEAYADSTRQEGLIAAINCVPEEGLPEQSVIVNRKDKVVADESMAYANKGSMKDNVEAGNFTDYFLDVADSGTYTITYSFQTLTSDGATYANAWELNRGVPDEYFSTNSYKQVSIPGLWTKDVVKMRQTLELSAGKQTLELKAKSGGYRILSFEIAPIDILDLEKMSDSESRTFMFNRFYDTKKASVILGENIEYTVDGSSFDYEITVGKTGTYELTANYAIESSGSVKMKAGLVTADAERELGQVDMPSTTAWNKFMDTDKMQFDLKEGKQTLRLTILNDGSNLKSFTLTFIGEKDEPEPPVDPPVDPNPPVDPEEPVDPPYVGPVVVAPSEDGIYEVRVDKTLPVVIDGKADIQYKISEKDLLRAAKQATADKPIKADIAITANELLNQIKDSSIKAVGIQVVIPKSIANSKVITINKIEIGKDVIAAAKENAKDIQITIQDENGKKAYSLEFSGKTLKAAKNTVDKVNAAIAIYLMNQDKEVMQNLDSVLDENVKENALIFDFAHNGILPATATVKADISKMNVVKPGDNVYVYYYNQKLESLAKTTLKVDENGFVGFKVKHCSKYIILPKEADAKIVTTLFDKTKVAANKTIKNGNRGNIVVNLPIDAQGEAILTYKSSNKSVVRVSKKGSILAIKGGKAVITTTVTINGKKQIYKTQISVTK